MQSSNKFIKIAQGITTKTYRFYDNGWCRRIEITHAELKPIIFRNFYKNQNLKISKKSDIL